MLRIFLCDKDPTYLKNINGLKRLTTRVEYTYIQSVITAIYVRVYTFYTLSSRPNNLCSDCNKLMTSRCVSPMHDDTYTYCPQRKISKCAVNENERTSRLTTDCEKMLIRSRNLRFIEQITFYRPSIEREKDQINLYRHLYVIIMY